MIRAATAQDAGWITDLWNAVIADTLITFTTVPKTGEDIGALIRDRTVLVLKDAGGFATYGPFRSGPGYAATVEHTILLAPGARGQGRGRALLTALMRDAAAQGHHVTVAGISAANPQAVAFHAALGFDRVGHMPQVGRKGDRWLDLILMQRRLDATPRATAPDDNCV